MTGGNGTTGLAVLTYHAFAARRSVTATEPSWFAETLAALTASGFHGVALDDWFARGRPDEPRGFALTFDDGLASILDVAGCVAALKVPAAVFVVTDRVGRDNAWAGQPGYVARERLLDWSELRSLGRAGFRIGSHGRTHRRLETLAPVALADELRGSRGVIEQTLGMPCPLLAYPYGSSSPRVRRAASRYYAAAFGTRLDYSSERQDPHDLARLDAYYLGSRRALDALVRGRWQGTLCWYRARRGLRRGAGRVAREFRALPGRGTPG